jgi:putative heme-binding domain-containing protein
VPAASAPADDLDTVVGLLELVLANDGGDHDTARQCLEAVTRKLQSREISGERLARLRPRLEAVLEPIISSRSDHPLRWDAALLAASWTNPPALAIVRGVASDAGQSDGRRLQALDALVAAGDAAALAAGTRILAAASSSEELRAGALAALARQDDPKVADLVLEAYSKLPGELRAKAIELMTERTTWSKRLLAAIGEGKIPPQVLGVNQVRKLLASKDDELVRQVRSRWGSVRAERNPQRERVVAEMRRLLAGSSGDARAGKVVFARVCGQCHKLDGEGADVGPDIAASGRGSFEQLLSNVFDPSLVIGAAYQAVTVRTVEGRVLTGLPVEDNPQRIVLKVQGGTLETIPRDDVDAVQVSKVSLMPEELERQLTRQEIIDLFSYLAQDRAAKADAAPSK